MLRVAIAGAVLIVGAGVAFSHLVSPAPEAPAASAVRLNEPPYVGFEVPSPKVTARIVGEGFEVINEDPALTGQKMDLYGVLPDGGRVLHTVTIPPPIPITNPAPPGE